MYDDLRRLLASLDYRFVHVTRGAPSGFGSFEAGADIRTPLAIVRHLCDLLGMIRRQFGQVDAASGSVDTGSTPDASLATPAESLTNSLESGFRLGESGSGPEDVDASAVESFEVECRRFRSALRELDRSLAEVPTFSPDRPELDFAGLLQGPVCDTLTHIGQLAMLRRLAGSPVERVRYWQVEMPLPASTGSTP
jgi:hypothetical protein